ncbi:MAG: hypothetical protein C0518_02725 [Opitutus sp.]|nr:hypothetical protein [Opitutus sp.]
MPHLAFLVFCVAVCVSRAQPTGYQTGMPFGPVGPKEVAQLETFANAQGTDLMGDLKLAYEKDEAALGRVFAFSLKFTKLDRRAKTYGQLIYSSFLNLGERFGLERYTQIVAAQPKDVRQRIRDFIYFDATLAPANERATVEAAARAGAPTLFPSDYVFGADNPLFRSGKRN